MKTGGHQTDYQQNHQFNSFIRRTCSLPFVPRDMVSRAMRILHRRKEDLVDNNRLYNFSGSLLEYINNTWINGVFCSQDWNLFDIDCQTVPTTNNGNEGENNRLSTIFSIHPQFYKFVLMVVEELQKTAEKVSDILDGVRRPKEGGTYNRLKNEREAAKKLLLDRCDRPTATDDYIDEQLDHFMGKLGCCSAR